jgi:hypothetical protein
MRIAEGRVGSGTDRRGSAQGFNPGTERFEFRSADFPKLKIQKGPAGLRLDIREYFRYGISYRNFCLLGIIFEVQSVKPPLTRAELAHTLYTLELSMIAKKLPAKFGKE